jgi:hypothetical protein
MVHVEFWRPGREIGQSECVATLTQRGRDAPKIEGREPQVVDLQRMVLSIGTGRTISWEDDPEEWARSLASSYRTPYLLAEIVHDDHPAPEVAGERLVVRQRVRS